jgi:hypothetical protein
MQRRAFLKTGVLDGSLVLVVATGMAQVLLRSH